VAILLGRFNFVIKGIKKELSFMENYVAFDLGSPSSRWHFHFEILPELFWIGHTELRPGNRFGFYLYIFGMHIDIP
jgi:hypothetical protein